MKSLKNKKSTKLPTETSTNKKAIVLTVLATLAVLALFVATFVAGIKWHERYTNGVENKAKTLVEVTSLKQ